MDIKILLVIIFLASGCSTYEKYRYITEEYEAPSKLFSSSFDHTWVAAIKTLSKRYEIKIENPSAGILKTNWMDNTKELNFIESFSKRKNFKSSKFMIIVNVEKGYRTGKEISKVTVYRRQLVEKDFLQGWRELPSDGIQEKNILYRIERLLKIDNKLKAIEDQRYKEQKARDISENF